MAYLLWAFAVVWFGVFAYLYRLMRLSQALERQIAALPHAQPTADSRTSAVTGAGGTSATARTHAASPSRARESGG